MMRFLPFAFLLAVGCQPAAAQQHNGARALAQLEKADRNSDGAVSKQEYTVFRASQFSRLDRNGDSFLTDEDIPAIAKGLLPPELSMDALKVSFDADGDGKVSRAEFNEGPTLVFDRVDANKDGLATEAELKAARAAFPNR